MMNKMIPEKIYAGLIGMDAGMRLGAPVENPYWTYERLREYYGDIRGYLRVHKNHTADDDVNGPMLLYRALTDNGTVNGLTPEMAGEAWLNYTRFGKGMFWWGGEDLSTEHRAYMNLRRGVKPPESGSAALNGKTASEQIGGQIFVDTWGLIWPGNPGKAAEYARTAASVSHDGSGLDGAAFMTACVAAAFDAGSVDEVIDAGLSVIPDDSDYAGVVRAVRQFYEEHPDNFRACRDFVEREWGHDKFPGGWHIVPNAGICLTGLLYGGGDLGRSIEICVMCGFDTDCNASNVGTILGVFGGLPGVPARYREPINDTVILSGVSGYLNMVDLPTLAKELYETACALRGDLSYGKCSNEYRNGYAECSERNHEGSREASASEYLNYGAGKCGAEERGARRCEIDSPTAAGFVRGELLYDFALPGSTHGLMLSDRASHTIRNVRRADGSGYLELMIDGKRPGPADLFFKGCFLRSDLDDERYEPVFSPRVYPGQTVKARMRARHPDLSEIAVTPYVTRAMTGDRVDLSPFVLPRAGTAGVKRGDDTVRKEEKSVWEMALSGQTKKAPAGEWIDVTFVVPDLSGDQVHDVGWQFTVTPDGDPWVMSFVEIDEIRVYGPASYTIDFGLQREEFGQITPFSLSDCEGLLEAGGRLCLTVKDEPTAAGSQAFTGNYYMEDVSVSVPAVIKEGESAMLLLRGQGTRRYYALGLAGENKAKILRYWNGRKDVLGEAAFSWERGREYILRAEVSGGKLTLWIDGEEILSAADGAFDYGMAGLGMAGPGVTSWGTVQIRSWDKGNHRNEKDSQNYH